MIRRRGGAYVLVLGVTTMVAVLGVGGVLAQRAQLESRTRLAEMAAARGAAIASLEWGMQWLADTSDWRSQLSSSPLIPSPPIDGANITILALAEDGTPLDASDTSESVRLGATASVGKAIQHYRVVLRPRTTPDPLLSKAIVSKEDVVFEDGSFLHATAPLRARKAEASSADVYADVVVSSDYRGGTYHGTTDDSATKPDVPVLLSDDLELLFRTATVINARALPQDGGTYWLSGALGPGVNTAGGSANADGIYLINGQGEPVGIRGLRLLGAVAIYNVHRDTIVIDGSNDLDAGSTGLPVLVINGDLASTMRTAPLAETDAGVSLNPVGMPDADGSTDKDTGDTFPSRIRGVVWVDRSVAIAWPGVMIQGVLIARQSVNVKEHATVRIAELEGLQEAPPAPFRNSGLMIDQATWTRVVD